jgi:hypothetical protein
MRPRYLLAFALSASFGSSSALAQSDEEHEPAPAATTPAARPAGPATCLLGLRPKAQEDSARAAARLFCDEVRARGVAIGDVTEQAPPDGEVYRVDVEPLGGQLSVRVAHERPPSTVRATRRLSLAGFEEMNVAAGRLAESLVRDKPLAETATVTSVVGADSAPARRKRGETLVGLGLIGVSAPAVGVIAAPGAEASLFYETPDVAIGASLAGASGEGAGGDGKVGYFAFSVGARHYLSRGDVAPYLGAGAAYTHQYLLSGERGADGERNGGLGAYLEGGVHLLRLHKHHLGAGLRLDAPLYQVEGRYSMPVTFNVTWLMQ